MNTHNFKFASRTLRKNKFSSFVKIISLVVTMSFSLILFIYLQNVLSYDKFHHNYKRIYRVGTHFINMNSGSEDLFDITGDNLGRLLKSYYPEIEDVVRIRKFKQKDVQYDDRHTLERNIIAADSNFFDVFTFDFIVGDKSSSFNGVNNIILTETMSHKYFGKNNPVGKCLLIDKKEYFVTGILKDSPSNSHIKFDAVISLSPRPLYDNLFNLQCQTYILFKHDNINIKDLSLKYPAFREKYLAEYEGYFNIQYKYFFTPIIDIHFDYKAKDRWFPNGNKVMTFVVVFVLIVLIILASINYINMSIFSSLKRTKELQIRMVLGTNRILLINLFLVETIIYFIISFIISVIAVLFLFLKTSFGDLIGIDLQLNYLSINSILLILISIFLIIFISLGLFSAFFISFFAYLKAFKNKFSSIKSMKYFRNSLLLFQFLITAIVLSFMLLMNKQLNYIKNKDLGFDKENIMVIPTKKGVETVNIVAFKNSLREESNVLSISAADDLPLNEVAFKQTKTINEKGEKIEKIMNLLIVDDNFINTLGIELVEGRDFIENSTEDRFKGYLVNEAFVESMGWENGVGKPLQAFGGPLNRQEGGSVIGVVKDFHYYSLQHKIEPLYIALYDENGSRRSDLGMYHGIIIIKLNKNNINHTVKAIEKKWSQFFPDQICDWSFLDDRIENLYKKEREQNKLILFISFISILLSCLGLISIFMSFLLSKEKEIAIRKVQGINLVQIILLLFKNVYLTVFMALIISIPITLWAFNNWFNQFLYKANINYTIIFIITGFTILTIAFFSVASIMIKAAKKSPAVVLRQ